MSDDDDKARDRADLLFIWERLQALDQATKRDGNAIGDAYRRIILDLLRSRTPGPRTLQEVAGELEELWWPEKYQKRYREQVFLRHATDLQSDLTALYGQLAALFRKRKPGTEAEKKVAEELGITVEALRKRPGTEAEKMTAEELGMTVEALRRRKGRYKKRARI